MEPAPAPTQRRPAIMNISARKPHTSDDYWNLPYDARTELINGELYAMSPPTRVHRRIVTRVAQ